MTLDKARQRLLELLFAWRSGEIEDPRHVPDVSGFIEEELVRAGLIEIQKETGGLADQVDSVLNQLTNAQLQQVLPQDIDIMVKLLETTGSNVPKALKEHADYWNSLDRKSREIKAMEYWFGKNH